MIYTFYSYRGGVGRTMALANVAELLCRRGLRVLMADLNLESPALEQYFPSVAPKALSEPGLLDLIRDFKLAMSEPPARPDAELPLPDIGKYLLKITPCGGDAPLLLLPPGARAGGVGYARYTEAVRLFDWADFYRNWEGKLFFEWLRRGLKGRADVVLVNSSPGISELSHVCTRLLADAVVMFCSASRQNMQGTFNVASELMTNGAERAPGRPTRLLIVPSRVERTQRELLKRFKADFVEKFGVFSPEGSRDGAGFFWSLRVPFVPYYSFREEVAARASDEARPARIVRAYRKIAGAMTALSTPESPLRQLQPTGPPAVGRASGAQPQFDGRPPYRGMEPFYEEHSHLYYGRMQSIKRLREMVKEPGLVVVTGQSGSGKSSLVFAGLLPEISAGRLPGSEHWPHVTFQPGGDPFVVMAARLAPLLRASRDETKPLRVGDLAARLAGGDVSLADVVGQALEGRPESARLLMIIDQFEELFTMVHVEDVRRDFQRQLLDALRGGRLSVVVTMRADFGWDVWLKSEPLASAPKVQILDLGSMTREEYWEAIVMPAHNAGVEFEAGLVERILADVGQEPGNLPLLQFALTELWSSRQGLRLTHSAYDQIGGVQGALTRRADDVYEKFSKEKQEIVRRIFTQLVHLDEGDGSKNTRRRATFEEMGGPAEDVREIVKSLGEARLLVCNPLPGAGDAPKESVEVAHEALIRDWGLLKKWVEQDRLFFLWRQTLRRRMAEWRLVRQGAEERRRLEEAKEALSKLRARGREEGRGSALHTLRVGAARLHVSLVRAENALLHLMRAASRSVFGLEGGGALLRDFPLKAASWWLRERGDELSREEKNYITDSARRQRIQQWTVRMVVLTVATISVFVVLNLIDQRRTIEDFRQTLYTRGLQLERERKTEEALQIYSQVLERDPKYAEARIRRADIYAALHRFDEAVEDYKTYVSLMPDAPEAHDRLGRALVERNKEGDFALALTHLDEALRLDPNFHPALYDRARLYARDGQPEKAIEDYERAFGLDPSYPENPDEAGRLNAEFAAAYVSRGLVRKNLGETAQAVEDFERAKRLKPGDAAILNNLAALYAASKDYGRAVENYELAHRAEPQNVEALRGLGESYAAKDEHAAAVENFKKALELLPPRERGDVYVGLGASYAARNMTREAREAFLTALREGSGDARLKARRQLETIPYDAPPSDAKIFIYYDSSVAPELADAVRRAVAGARFQTLSVSPTEQEVDWAQVRYFHKQDRGNADRVFRIVAEELRKSGEAWDVRLKPFSPLGTDQNFGHIEVFIIAPRPTEPPVLQGARPEN